MNLIFEIIFWGAAAMLAYVYAGYPALLAIMATFHRQPRPQPGYCPSLSVLISAFNEVASIGKKIERTLALDYPPDKLQIVVVSDGSTDGTEAAVRSFSDSRVRLIRIEERRGKTHAQNEGVKHCRGEVVVFSDATTVYHAKALLYLACHYADPAVGAVSGRYQYFDADGKSPTETGSIAFWNYENLIKKFQSRIRTLTGCSGCIYSVRRSLYTPLGDDMLSDVVEPLCVLRKGHRVVFEERALASEETTKSSAEEFRMRVRVVTRGIRALLAMRELFQFSKYGWVSFQLLSHKVLRWMVCLFLILLLGSSAALAGHEPFRSLFAMQALFYGMALASMLIPLHRKWKPLGIPLYFCTLNAAALLSLLEVFRGRKYTVWQTVRR